MTSPQTITVDPESDLADADRSVTTADLMLDSVTAIRDMAKEDLEAARDKYEEFCSIVERQTVECVRLHELAAAEREAAGVKLTATGYVAA